MVVCGVLVCTGAQAQLIRTRVPSSPFETVTIAYTANIRGLRTEDHTTAPVSAFVTMVGGLRHEYPEMLLVDLGNFIGPAPPSILTEGRFDFDVLERLGYDLVHVSSDDFDIGSETLSRRIAETKIPVLSGNLTRAGDLGLSWVVLPCGNRKVGFIGVTSIQFPKLVLENLRKDTVVAAAASYITQAIAAMEGKADIVVALTDLDEGEMAQIRDVPGLDLILTTGGNSVKPGSDWISVGFPGTKRAAIARVLSTGTATYVLDLHGHPDENKWTIDEVVGEVYPITKDTPRDPATDLWMKGRLVNILQANNATLGTLQRALPNDDGKKQQTPLGQAITDLMRSQTKAHLALVDSGALRNGLQAGPVTAWDLIEAIPYPDPVVVVRLTGEQILSVISLSSRKVGEDGYLQFSNLETEPAELGNRIGSLKILPDRTYLVAMPEFLAQGGDGYEDLKTAPVVATTGLTLADLCRQALERYGTMAVDHLPMGEESHFWYARLHLASSIDGYVADPDTFHFYPEQVTLAGQQLVASSFDARLEVIRADELSEFQNSVEAQYGLWWDQKWVPSQTLDNLLVGSQVTLYLSNLIFGGDRIADPYVSALLETALLYPDPTGVMFASGAPRPGSLKLGVGISAPTLLRPFGLKVGLRWEKQPFDPTVATSTGVEGIATLNTELIRDVLSVNSSTDVVSSLDSPNHGVTVSSIDEVLISLKKNLSIGPRLQLFYNSLVGHWSYLFDVSLILDLKFQ